MNLEPGQYESISAYELLSAAARGYIGVDHRLLHAIVDHRETTLADVVRFAAEDREDDPLSLDEDLLAIFHYWRAPESLPFYLKLARDTSAGISDELVEAFARVGPEAVDPLLALYEELGEEQGADVAFLLATLNVRDPRILDVLMERLNFDAGDAALALDVYGDPAAIPALERIAAGPGVDETLLREIETVITDLRNPRTRDPEPPFDIWSLYSEEAEPVFDVLNEEDCVRMLDSASASRRAQAAASLFGKQLAPRSRARVLEIARTDADPNVRGRAWEALSDLADEPEVRRSMTAVLCSNAEVEERGGAAVALSQYTDQAKVRAAIEELYHDPRGRAKALEAMWRSADRTYGPLAVKHLNDADLETRRQAIWGIGHLGVTSQAPKLRELFQDEELRADALFAYALACPGQVSRSRVRGLLRRIDEQAGGLSLGETELVEMALDQRLQMLGFEPVFDVEEQEASNAPVVSVGRNDPCPCGSGKKYKKCCGSA